MVQAVVVTEPGAVPQVREIELPALGRGDVRVRIAAAGVCHSDLSMVNGVMIPEFPAVLGHEASGTVQAVGDGVRGLAPGDRVVMNWAAACRECWFCRNGQPWLCSTAEGIASVQRGVLTDGTPVHMCMGVGAFAEEIVLPSKSVVPLPDGIPLDIAALLGCAVLTGLGAVRHAAGVRSGQSVLVVGLGGIGLCTVLGAKRAGADTIVAVDVHPEKEQLARKVGATEFLLNEPDLPRKVRSLTEGRGVDHAFECVGSPTTVRIAWRSVRRGGQCIILGVGGKDQEVTFNMMELFHFARTLSSSIYGSSDPDRDVPILAGEILAGDLDLSPLITHRIGLHDVPEAFGRMQAGQGARSLIVLDC